MGAQSDDGKKLATRIERSAGAETGMGARAAAARGSGPTALSELAKARDQLVREIARWQSRYLSFPTWCLT